MRLATIAAASLAFLAAAACKPVPASVPAPEAAPRGRSPSTAPVGSYIVERPGKDKKVVHVRVMDERRPGVVVRMRVYEIRDGKLVRQG